MSGQEKCKFKSQWAEPGIGWWGHSKKEGIRSEEEIEGSILSPYSMIGQGMIN